MPNYIESWVTENGQIVDIRDKDAIHYIDSSVPEDLTNYIDDRIQLLLPQMIEDYAVQESEPQIVIQKQIGENLYETADNATVTKSFISTAYKSGRILVKGEFELDLSSDTWTEIGQSGFYFSSGYRLQFPNDLFSSDLVCEFSVSGVVGKRSAIYVGDYSGISENDCHSQVVYISVPGTQSTTQKCKISVLAAGTHSES